MSRKIRSTGCCCRMPRASTALLHLPAKWRMGDGVDVFFHQQEGWRFIVDGEAVYFFTVIGWRQGFAC